LQTHADIDTDINSDIDINTDVDTYTHRRRSTPWH